MKSYVVTYLTCNEIIIVSKGLNRLVFSHSNYVTSIINFLTMDISVLHVFVATELYC